MAHFEGAWRGLLRAIFGGFGAPRSPRDKILGGLEKALKGLPLPILGSFLGSSKGSKLGFTWTPGAPWRAKMGNLDQGPRSGSSGLKIGL